MKILTIANRRRSRRLEAAIHADIDMCYTCGACDGACPINAAANRLRPRTIVRLAALGFLDELIRLPDVWYCLQCRACADACPNRVKPHTVAAWARAEALRAGVVEVPRAMHLFAWMSEFQAARRQALSVVLAGRRTPFVVAADAPRAAPEAAIHFDCGRSAPVRGRNLRCQTTACFTCGECSSACPACGGRGIFDPREIFRKVTLGMIEELIESPDIWMCLQCGNCTDACPQRVDGKHVIAVLQDLAISAGTVPGDWQQRRRTAEKSIYQCLTTHIDRMLHAQKDAPSFTCDIAAC